MTFINFGNPFANANNSLVSTNDAFDVINGFGGIDTVSYVTATSGVTVKLSTTGFQNTGGSGFDRLISIENLTGSNFNDILGGDGGDNVLDGGAGIDTVTYAHATGGVTVSLSITTGQFTGGAGVDTLSNFENLTGSIFNDTLSGNSGNNILNGGAGIDTVSYSNATSGVAVSLALTGPQATGGAGTDTLIGFENLTGSSFDDKLSGDSGDNTILGLLGNDFFVGTQGNDTLDGDSGTDTADYSGLGGPVTLGAFGQLTKGGFGEDKLVKIETIIGSSGIGDTIDHSGISFAGSPATGTDTNLSTFTSTVFGTPPLPLKFTVRNFENVIGSDLSDGITGDSFNNLLSGAGGDDKISGLAGNDVLEGGKGNDSLDGGLGNDFLEGGLGTDILTDTLGGSDVFNFTSAAESVVGALRDVIIGFTTGAGGDFLGLAEIDANTTTVGVDEAFTSLIASPVFTANQQLRYTISSGNLNLFGNTDANNSTAEFEIQINGLVSGITFANIFA